MRRTKLQLVAERLMMAPNNLAFVSLQQGDGTLAFGQDTEDRLFEGRSR